MPENDKTNPDKNVKTGKDKKDSQRGLWIIIGVGAAVLLIIIVVGSFFVDSQKIRFITEFSLTVTLATLVGVQAYIYHRQWDAMNAALEIERAKIAPRLRVDEVRVAGFEIGQSPAFIVSLVNEGATEAQDVALYVQAERGGVRTKWRGEQIVTVPANDRRTYPIRWSAVLSQEVIDFYNNNEPWLKVFGYFKYKDIEQSFCYSYYPWIGKRPAEVPYFVPCDFDARTDVNITLGIQDSTHGHTAENVPLVHERTKAKPDKGNEDGKDEDDQQNPADP